MSFYYAQWFILVLLEWKRFRPTPKDSTTVIIDFIILRAYRSGKEDNPLCAIYGFENTFMKLIRHLSFVDCS